LEFKNQDNAKKSISKFGFYISSKDHIYRLAGGIASKSRRKKIEFGFDSISHLAKYIHEINTERCPVFGFPLIVNFNAGPAYNSISVDRINPKKGYVKGNLQVISVLANRMKWDATPKELKQFANWIIEENQNA
jgi:hypothetical protein